MFFNIIFYHLSITIRYCFHKSFLYIYSRKLRYILRYIFLLLKFSQHIPNPNQSFRYFINLFYCSNHYT